MQNAINWFEIAVADMPRAKRFYSALYDVEDLYTTEMMDIQMSFLPAEDSPSVVGGALCAGEWYKPSADSGALVYLNANPDLNTMLGRVEAAGGKVLMEKTSLGDHGFMAFFLDSEGNRIGLHSNG
jgi:hypothetical protein